MDKVVEMDEINFTNRAIMYSGSEAAFAPVRRRLENQEKRIQECISYTSSKNEAAKVHFPQKSVLYPLADLFLEKKCNE